MKGKGALVKTLTGLAFAFSLFGLPVKSANAEIPILPIQFQIISHPRDDKSSQTTRQSSPQQPQKHYNWIKPNRYSDWQCAYELTYDGEVPEGFKLYVDIDGDNKPDYKFGYYMDRYYASSNSFTYIFYRKGSDWPVSSIYDSWKKVLNVCAPMAIRKFFYERNDTWDDPSTFEEMNLDSDYNYIKAKFLQ